MENSSYEDESKSENPPQNPAGNPPSPANPEPQAGPSGISRVQASEGDPPLAKISEDDEPPSAHVQRYMQQDKKMKLEEMENLEYPAPEPVSGSHDVRNDPEFQQQARNRKARRAMQNSVEGPCSLRPDPPRVAPLPAPEPYDDADPAAALTPIPRSAVLSRLDAVYERVCRFSFQFPLHTILLTWPLATAVMGVMNLKLCRMNDVLPYLMLSVGIFGTATHLYRLYLLYFEKRCTTVGNELYWACLLAAEILVWVFFTAEMYYFFSETPSFSLGDEHYCKPRIYKINYGLMAVSSLAMLGWLIVHLAKFINYIRRNEPAPA